MTRPLALAAHALAACVLAPGPLAAPAVGQDGSPAKTHELQPEDYFSLRSVGAVAASPGGDLVAYTLAGWEEGGETMNVDLWVADAGGGGSARLTFDPAADGSPAWSADGGTIYFTSARSGGDAPPTDGDAQVWKIDADGQNLSAVTRVPGGIEGYALAPADGPAGSIYYTTPREVVEDDLAGLRSKYKSLDYGHGLVKYSTLHRLDLSTWRSGEVAAPDRYIRAFAVSDDGGTVAMVTDPDRNLITHEGQSRVDVLDVDSGETVTAFADADRADHPSPYGWIDAPDINPDGGLCFTVAFDGYPTKLYVGRREGSAYDLVEVRAVDPVTIVDGSAEWADVGGGSATVACLGEGLGRTRIYFADVSGSEVATFETSALGDVVVSDFDATEAGVFAALGTPSELGNVYRLTPEGWDKLTDVNPHTADWKFPEVEIYKWTGEGGVPVEGILELPPGYEKGDGPLPTVVVIHGGPTAATSYKRQFRIYGHSLLAAKGYAVLAPNYRGSTGYGEDFMVQLIGRENDVEVEDIVTGVEALVKEGIADPAKLGVMGWSNGGFLTNALLSETVTVPAGGEGGGGTKEVRFAAASSGAGVVDQVIQWGTEDTPGHVVNYMSGKLPWEFPAEYVESSPLYELNKTTTPTLIHVGAADARVPPEHAKTLYRALFNYLDVPAELIVYPGEPHGLQQRKHRAAKMAWDHAWFEKYLGGGGKE